MLTKRRFWTAELSVAFAFLKHFYGPIDSPHEDFGTSKPMWVRPFVSTFHTRNYSIWSKCDDNCFKRSYIHIFDFPKSSFETIDYQG